MDVGRVASLFIESVESLLKGNAIRLTLAFKIPIDRGRLAVAFRRLVESHQSLRLRFEPGGWSPMPGADLESALEEQNTRLALQADPGQIYAEHRPTNVGLPIRIDVLDDLHIVLSLNHVFGNGKAAFYYLENLLRRYDGPGEDEALAADDTPSPARASWLGRSAQVVTGVFWACAYLSLFAWRAGRRAGAATVDLSRGKKPEEPRDGYAVWTYQLGTDGTGAALERSTAAGLTFTAHLCRVIAVELLEIQPEKSRVCLSVPTDLSAFTPGFSPETAGNFTGALIVQLWRSDPGGRSLDQQTRRAFWWAGRAVHYWVPWLLGQLAGSEAKLSARYLRQARRPIPQRAPFEDFSGAVSSVGVVQGAMARKYLAAVSAHTRTQTIMLCAITLNAAMSLEVSMPLALFNKAEVMGLTDRAVARLTGMPLQDAVGRRVDLFPEKNTRDL